MPIMLRAVTIGVTSKSQTSNKNTKGAEMRNVSVSASIVLSCIGDLPRFEVTSVSFGGNALGGMMMKVVPCTGNSC